MKQYLLDARVIISLYEDIVSDILNHVEHKKRAVQVWMDKPQCNYALVRSILPKLLLDWQNPMIPLKACKNVAEMEGMRWAHVIDGVAMAHFMAWLQDAIMNQHRCVSEVEIDLVLVITMAVLEANRMHHCRLTYMIFAV